ncbi:MAG: hypothetical protein ACE5M4_01020 [Anaerolineales bacterium]
MDKHPRLQELFSKIAAGRNIYINFPVAQGLVTYPAGYLFGLRQPITSANRSAWGLFADRLRDAGKAAPLKLVAVKEGFILKLTAAGVVLREEVAIADHSTLLLHLQDALDLICESDAVPGEKEQRLTVMSVEDLARGRLIVYPGDESRGFLPFSVLPLTHSKLEKHGLEDLYREVSLRLPASHS